MLTFIGIGAQKAGTTWLFEHMRKHPQVSFPAGKEIHFWDAQLDKGIEWYENLFRSPILVEGEITPAYAIQPRNIIDLIWRHFPQLRLIYVLRNPIERAWSSALMALVRSELDYEEASDQWFLDHFHSRGSLRRGDYENCLRTWRSVYPEEQLLVLFYDDLMDNPLQLLRLCACHIGIDPKFFDQCSEKILRERVFAGQAIPLRPILRNALQHLYAKKIGALGALTNRNLDHWLE